MRRITKGSSRETPPSHHPVCDRRGAAWALPIIATPGTATGTATASVIDAEPTTWALGRGTPNDAVQPKWTITNSGNKTATIGEPHVQMNQRCCPGALTSQGSSTLSPGAKTGLTFELSMHPDMHTTRPLGSRHEGNHRRPVTSRPREDEHRPISRTPRSSDRN